jgi:hypothetical protein
MSCEEISLSGGWGGNPTNFVRAMIDSEWIDGDLNDSSTLQIHDWEDHCGKLMNRLAADAKRKREERVRRTSTGRPQDVRGTSDGNVHTITAAAAAPLPLPLPLQHPTDADENGPENGEKQTENSEGGGAAVENGKTDSTTPKLDSSILDQPNLNKSLDYLLDLGIEDKVARTLASTCSLRSVVQAYYDSLGKRKRAGYTIAALKGSYPFPPLPPPIEIELVNQITPHEASNMQSVSGVRERHPMLPGESDHDWLKRIQKQFQEQDSAKS